MHPGFTERHAGTIVSLAVHIALFVILSNTTVQRSINASPRPEPIRIEFDRPTPEEPEVEQEIEAPPEPPAYDRAASTRAELQSEEVSEPATPSAVEVASLEPADPVLEFEPAAATFAEKDSQAATDSPASEDGTVVAPPETALSAEMRKYLDEQREKVKRLNEKVARQGSGDVARRLSLARIKIEGQKWLDTTEGATEGVMRSMTTLGVPPSAADDVCARYGIRIILAQVDASDVTGGFLNRAETASGTYYNRVGKGQYQVFSFSERALARMVRIEREELEKRGHDPRNTRVLEVEYGIVRTPGGYDLGIKKFRVAPIQLEP